ncbi:MAG: metallophosphoesterase [Myxococcales bacterium]|nr:metallophosphoesterase [Myxococcales bacterium]
MRVLHLSDVHVDVPFAAMPAGGWAYPKRWLGGANLALRRKRRFRDAAEKLRILADFRREMDVDLVVCTGDYTALGTEAELRAARLAIAPLTDAPLGFATIGGNHDVYVPDAVGRFERIFADLLDPGPWPKVRIVDDTVAIVALDSTRPNPQPWRSSGRIPDPQLAALPKVLEGLGDRFVFVITHYAPRLADGRPDRFTHGLTNADALLTACAELKGAILHGHVHRRYRVRVPGVVPELFCAGSTTEAGHEGFWLYEVEGGTLRATPGGYRDGRYVLLETRS